MAESPPSNSIIGIILKTIAIAIVYFVGALIAGAVVNAAGLPFPEIPDHVYNPVVSFVASLLLAAAVTLLARGLTGSFTTRWLIMAVFFYVSFGLNNQIEAAVFTTQGGFATMVLFFILPCGSASAAAAALFKPRASGHELSTVFADRTPARWWWRALLVWISFPVIYHVFGLLIYPLVRDFYEQQQGGLSLPPQSLLLAAVFLRSLLFLLVTIPVLTHWGGSRRQLTVSLGAALAIMVGIAGLVEITAWPASMRIVHGTEILADSFVHAWVIVALLVSKSSAVASQESDRPAEATA